MLFLNKNISAKIIRKLICQLSGKKSFVSDIFHYYRQTWTGKLACPDLYILELLLKEIA